MTGSGGHAQRRAMLTLDILPTILEHIYSTDDLYNLCLTSRSVAYYTLSRLYDGTLFLAPSRPDANRRVSVLAIPKRATI